MKKRVETYYNIMFEILQTNLSDYNTHLLIFLKFFIKEIRVTEPKVNLKSVYI